MPESRRFSMRCLNRDAAIVAPIAGTTRDVIVARVIRDGQLYSLIDTAGLVEETDDPIEREGVLRARETLTTADLVLWLGDSPPDARHRTLWVRGRCDLPGRRQRRRLRLHGLGPEAETVERLWTLVGAAIKDAVQLTDSYLLQESQHAVLTDAAACVDWAIGVADPLVRAEHLRLAAGRLAALVGVDHTEAMLDALFSRFCVGK